mmetsp:Transcript_9035/g.28182  ORF Transcript_9035/g.28182 Transcript_9035/m.28182 type:complete len:306 (+) Transcript_9035:1026-1943(+)
MPEPPATPPSPCQPSSQRSSVSSSCCSSSSAPQSGGTRGESSRPAMRSFTHASPSSADCFSTPAKSRWKTQCSERLRSSCVSRPVSTSSCILLSVACWSQSELVASSILRSSSFRSCTSLGLRPPSLPGRRLAVPQASHRAQASAPRVLRGRSRGPHSLWLASIQPSSPASLTQPSKFWSCAKTYSPCFRVPSARASLLGDSLTGTPLLASTSRQHMPWGWYSGTARSTGPAWPWRESSTGSATSPTPSTPCMCESSQPGSEASFSQPFTVISLQMMRPPRDFLPFSLACACGSARTTPVVATTS